MGALAVHGILDPVKIRRAHSEEHLEIVQQLHDEVFSSLDSDPRVGDGDWWLVWEGEEPVAFAGGRVVSEVGFYYLCRVGVVPSARGLGLQRRLIRVRVNQARKQGLQEVITDTTASNLPSANNLIREGFTLYLPSYQWAGADGLYWRRPL